MWLPSAPVRSESPSVATNSSLTSSAILFSSLMWCTSQGACAEPLLRTVPMISGGFFYLQSTLLLCFCRRELHVSMWNSLFHFKPKKCTLKQWTRCSLCTSSLILIELNVHSLKPMLKPRNIIFFSCNILILEKKLCEWSLVHNLSLSALTYDNIKFGVILKYSKL